MKIIITEEQYDTVINPKSLFWIKRRIDLVKEELKETFELMESDICKIDDYEKFEKKFFTVLMEGLHPYLYNDDNIGSIEYNEMHELLKDLFYVDCTEFYFAGREKC